MKTSISTAYKQYMIMIKDALKKVNDVFSNSTYSLSDTQQVLDEYSDLKSKLSDTMTASEFSRYLSEVSDFMSLAASSISASSPSISLPQASSV
jgi:ABC-type transporter Mla subunit MlaD